MSERKYDISELEILYNTYGKFYYLIRRENKLDGDVLFFDIDSGEQLDLSSFSEIGYKMVRNKRMLLNSGDKYTLQDLKQIADVFEKASLRKRELPEEYLVDINVVLDAIESNKFSYDIRYPVEQLDARYNDVTGEYLILYYEFDAMKKKFVYLDVTTGLEVSWRDLGMYRSIPREEMFNQADYSPREIIDMLGRLNNKGPSFKKRGQ